jgi:hypothetical protein
MPLRCVECGAWAIYRSPETVWLCARHAPPSEQRPACKSCDHPAALFDANRAAWVCWFHAGATALLK